VLLPATGAAAKALGKPDGVATFSYGVLNNPTVANNGHTLQVSLPADFKSDVKIPIKGIGRVACCLGPHSQLETPQPLELLGTVLSQKTRAVAYSTNTPLPAAQVRQRVHVP
jgi:hypothetical protein